MSEFELHSVKHHHHHLSTDNRAALDAADAVVSGDELSVSCQQVNKLCLSRDSVSFMSFCQKVKVKVRYLI